VQKAMKRYVTERAEVLPAGSAEMRQLHALLERVLRSAPDRWSTFNDDAKELTR
jgi:hypothetical protein